MNVLEILMELNIIPILNKNRFSFSLFTLFLIHTCKEQTHRLIKCVVEMILLFIYAVAY